MCSHLLYKNFKVYSKAKYIFLNQHIAIINWYLSIREKPDYPKWHIKDFFLFELLGVYDQIILFCISDSFLVTCFDNFIFISTACGEILTELSGTIQSPGHPNIYPHGIKCTWRISVLPGYLINLVFRQFHLEFHYNCTKDYLDVYDTGSGTSLGRWNYLVFFFFF